MSANTGNEVASKNGALDTIVWVVVAALVTAGVVGNSYYDTQSVLYRVLALLVLALVAGGVALLSSQGRAFVGMLRDSWVEVRKVVWPTKQESVQTTWVVVVFVAILALVLWGVDSLLSVGVAQIIG